MTAMNPLLARTGFVLVAVCGVLCGTTAAFVPTRSAEPHGSLQQLQRLRIEKSIAWSLVVYFDLLTRLNRGVPVLLTEARLPKQTSSPRKMVLSEEGPSRDANEHCPIVYELGIADQLVLLTKLFLLGVPQ
jgi:hypothetical protein